MKITLEESDLNKAQRLLSCDEAFSLLYDIDQKLRGYLKYETKLTRDEIMEEVREDINESNLLDLYQ